MPDITTMDLAQLQPVAGDYDIDTDGMDEAALRAAILAAEGAVDTTEEDDFEAGAAEEHAKRQALARRAEGHDVDETQHPMFRAPKASPAPSAVQVHNTELPKDGKDGKCPHCGNWTANGLYVTEFQEMSPGSQNSTDQQFTCNECAGEWGPLVDKPKKARAPSGTSNGLKIEANREERNGVKRPSAGGKCRGIWDELDRQWNTTAKIPTGKDARDALLADGYDKTTIMVQYYRWRKFMGIEGRQS